uniref:Uncharacterized protein n=1 Tax=Molossus molossus TaxID=27622 RepID=A0A7J8HBS1_MOLMO|nr:hypothetical protein HJG59_011090 [Molossus molossus]
MCCVDSVKVGQRRRARSQDREEQQDSRSAPPKPRARVSTTVLRGGLPPPARGGRGDGSALSPGGVSSRDRSPPSLTQRPQPGPSPFGWRKTGVRRSARRTAPGIRAPASLLVRNQEAREAGAFASQLPGLPCGRALGGLLQADGCVEAKRSSHVLHVCYMGEDMPMTWVSGRR